MHEGGRPRASDSDFVDYLAGVIFRDGRVTPSESALSRTCSICARRPAFAQRDTGQFVYFERSGCLFNGPADAMNDVDLDT